MLFRSILLKPGRLTVAEFEIMKTHAMIGYTAIMKASDLTHDNDFLQFAAEIALTHHEKWDGSGYPTGLSERTIPVSGRIMAVVDVYDALVSERHYKPRMTHEQAIAVLEEGRGTHFDPLIVDAVVALSDKIRIVCIQGAAAVPLRTAQSAVRQLQEELS